MTLWQVDQVTFGGSINFNKAHYGKTNEAVRETPFFPVDFRYTFSFSLSLFRRVDIGEGK